MSLLEKYWCQRLGLFLFFACCAAVMLAPLAWDPTVPSTIDYFDHISAIIQAKLALAEGQFPLRIASAQEWRYPFYQFYSTTSYTIAGLIYRWLIPGNPYTVFKFTLWCAFVIGGLYMYRLAHWFIKSRQVAMLTGVIYIASPYIYLLVNHIGAFNEAIALGVIPVVLFYSMICFYRPLHYLSILQASFAWYLLATIHITTFLYTSLFVAILLLVYVGIHRECWKNLLRVGVAYGFSLLLAAWYLAPIVLFSKYLLIANTLLQPQTMAYYKPLFSSLVSPFFTISSVMNKTNDTLDLIKGIHPNIGILFIMAVVICLYAVVKKQLLANKLADNWLLPLLVLFFIVCFLVWSPINVWLWVPHYFMGVQYSWRLLGQLTWIGSLLFAWAVSWMFHNKLTTVQMLVGVMGVFILAFVHNPPPEKRTDAVASLVKHQQLILNRIYIVNPRAHPEAVNILDSVSLRFFLPRETAKNSSPIAFQPIPTSVIKSAYAPSILVEGWFEDKSGESKQLAALIDGVVIAATVIKPGMIHWDLPINSIQNEIKNKPLVYLQYKIVPSKGDEKSSDKPAIQLQKLVLNGFMKPSEKLDVMAVQPHCQQQKDIGVCNIAVPSTTRLVELPILYYPELLSITVNGKPAPYWSVLYQDTLIAGVKPAPGKVNVITYQFRGLLWANFLSQLAWGFFVIFSVYILLRRLFYPVS